MERELKDVPLPSMCWNERRVKCQLTGNISSTIQKRRTIVVMSGIWNKVYKSDNTFFGAEPSNFALLCFNHMSVNNVKKVFGSGRRSWKRKPKAFNFFSVRNQDDKSYGSGVEVDRGIYEINGFQIRYFTKKGDR